jgi:amino acid adenylation domain-containing protein
MPDITLTNITPLVPEKDHWKNRTNDVEGPFLYTGYVPLDYPRDKTIIDLFEEQVKQTPANKAVIFNDLELSYQEFNSLANQFADYLRKTYRVKPDDLVGVSLDRSEWMMIAILGVLKAGAGYVPIGIDYPKERINYVLQDSGCKALINEEELQKFRKVQDRHDTENQCIGLQPDHLMYCIYTSGSTGLPKGVLVEHKSVVNLVYSQKKEFGITADERILQFSSISFDASVEQIWLALLSGAALVVLNKAKLQDIKALEHYIIDKKVSHIHTVPAYLSELAISDMSSVKRIIAGGDICPPYLAKRWLPKCAFYNEYGPTETTVTSIEYRAEPQSSPHNFVPIGKPIANTEIYILDENQKIPPHGLPGEIYIGGEGITRGYLNRPELTAERFIDNPYKPGNIIYRSGDLGRWLSDGNLECLGRIDEQVKISGFRVELGEIASVLQKHSEVKDAFVIAANVNGQDNELVAYIIGSTDTTGLREYLKDHLPPYMVPGYYVHLEAFPLNNNGKIDRKLLPLPTERYHLKKEAFATPGTAAEKTLTDIWQDMLDIERIGVDDDFFDLGGTSLTVIKIINRINKQFGSNLRLASIYQQRTIRQLAEKLETSTTEEVSPIVLLKRGEGTPLFIFPPWSSYPTIFNEFVDHYEGTGPLYGILYTEDTEDFPFKTVQDYARYIIDAIKSIQPTGPYALLGYSLGARTILEVGIQMQQANDKIDLLGVISHYPAFPPKGLLLSRRLRDEVRIFTSINLGLKFKYLFNRFPHFVKLLIKGDHEKQEIKVDIDTQKKILEIHEQYETDLKYNGNLVLIYEKSPDGHPSEYKKAQVYRNSIFPKLWQQYVDGKVIVKIIDAKHIDFFKKPAVEEVTDIVESYLK